MTQEDEVRVAIHTALDEVAEPIPGLVPAAMERIRSAGPRRRWGPAIQVAGVLVVGAVVGGLIFVSLPSKSQFRVQAPIAGPHEVISLLANNELVLVPPGGMGLKWKVRVARAPSTSGTQGYLNTGHFLALKDRENLYVLPPDGFLGGSTLVTVDPMTGRVKQTTKLPAGATFGSLAVGPQTGRVFLVGQRPGQLLVSVFDPARNAITDTWTVRDMGHWKLQGPVGGNFTIYQVTVTQDEKRLYYSYFGGLLSLSGLDWVDFTDAGPKPCMPPRPDRACLLGLAGFQLYQGGILITSAIDAEDGVINHIGLDGKLRKSFHLKLGGGFLEDFALDTADGLLYAVGSCGYTGGVSVLTLATEDANVLVPPQPGEFKTIPCGGRLQLNGPGELVVGSVHALLARPDAQGHLIFLSPKTGKKERDISVPAEPVDVLVLP